MKKKIASLLLAFVMCLTLIPVSTFAAYTPPTGYGAPTNVGVVFSNDFDLDPNGRWNFQISYGASNEIRALQAAYENGSLDEAGYNSLGISVQGDYKLDNGPWRSDQSGYEDMLKDSYAGFSADSGEWTSYWLISDYNFEDVFKDGILPGGNSYFDSHTISFRFRFTVSCYNSNNDEHLNYYSPWSSVVSYTNNQKVEDPAALINHAPSLITAEMKKDVDGRPYVDFRAGKAHDDVQTLNSISSQRVTTNVWVRLSGGEWFDAGEYIWLKEQFNIEARDLFANVDNFDAIQFEVKFRYGFDYYYYPQAGKTGVIYSPFSNVIASGVSAFKASEWAKPELEKAGAQGLIPDILKGADLTKPITREEFCELALVLYEKSTGKAAAPVSLNPFTDTSNPQILKAYTLGITTGTSGTTFEPNKTITREQCATMLFRAIKVIKPDGNFSVTRVADFKDQNEVSQYAQEATKYMSGLGIIKGDAGYFMPKANPSRSQAVNYGTATREAAILMSIRTSDKIDSIGRQ